MSPWALANTAPVAEDGRFPLGVGVKAKLAATDSDGDNLTFSIVSAPKKGTVKIDNNTTGDFTYTPTAGIAGNDSFTFKVNDGTVDSNVATVKILPTLSITSSLAVLAEGNTTQINAADISVRRTGDTDKNLIVSIARTGSAEDTRDYNLSIGSTLNSSGGLLSGTLTVLADEIVEGDETVILTLEEGADYMVGAPASVTILIQDPSALMPKANFQIDQMVQEGNAATVRVDLSEVAQFYPVRIPFTLSGRPGFPPAILNDDFTVTDKNANPTNEILITEGTTGQVTIQTIPDGLNEPTDETVVFNMGQIENARAGSFRTHTVFITERNIQAAVNLVATQGGKPTRTITADGGEVTVTATVKDINADQRHTYVWDLSHNALNRKANTASNLYIFNPSGLAPGFYKVRVGVADDGGAPVITRVELQLRIIQTAPSFIAENDTDADTILDSDDGYGDDDNDGIQNYYDHATVPIHHLQQQTLRADRFLMKTRPGLSLRLGDTAMATGRDASLVTAQDIGSYGGGEGSTALNATDVQVNSGGYYDFEIHGLPIPGMAVPVVIPQTQPIPKDAVMRKYTNTAFWHDFTINNGNQVFSAAGALGDCPPAGDPSYAPGLNEGHFCVQLLIQDGGPNDADGEANYIIKDPSGLVSSLLDGDDRNVRGICGNLFCSQGGSGALGVASFTALFLIAAFAARRWRCHGNSDWS